MELYSKTDGFKNLSWPTEPQSPSKNAVSFKIPGSKKPNSQEHSFTVQIKNDGTIFLIKHLVEKLEE